MPMFKELPDYVKLNIKTDLRKGYQAKSLKSGLDLIRKIDFTLADKIEDAGSVVK
jgi:hypothetical protein